MIDAILIRQRKKMMRRLDETDPRLPSSRRFDQIPSRLSLATSY